MGIDDGESHVSALWGEEGTSAVALRVDRAWLEAPEHVALMLAVERFVDAGHLHRFDEGETLRFSATFADWAAIGRSPEEFSEPEERENAGTLVRAIGALIPEPPVPLKVRLQGLFGKDRSTLILRAGGADVVLDEGWPRIAGRMWIMTPSQAAIVEGIRAYRHATSEAARVEAGLMVRERVGTIDSGLELPDVMLRKRLIEARSLTLSVEDAEIGDGSLSVVTRIEDEDGQVTRVRALTRHGSGAFIETADNVYIRLTEAQQGAVRETASKKGVSAASFGEGLEHPERLLSASSIDETIRFEGYSERVLAFRPVAPELPDRIASGLRWYVEEDVGPTEDDAFVAFNLRHPDSRELKRVRLATREDAETVVGALTVHLESNQDHVALDWQDLRFESPRQVLAYLERCLKEDVEGARRGSLVADLADALPPQVAACAPVRVPPWEVLETLFRDDRRPLEHQREAIQWLWSRLGVAEAGGARGVLLADDMGLGKTFQISCILALMRHQRRHSCPHLVVAPKILLENWEREIAKFFKPGVLSVRIVRAADLRAGGPLVDGMGVVHDRELQENDVWLVTYDSLQSFGPTLLQPNWDAVVLDEAQAIKNPATARSRNARGLKARFAIASTGTPVENRLEDIFPISDFAFPGVLGGNPNEFRTRFPTADGRAVQQMRSTLRYGDGPDALLLRREKALVMQTLPPKVTTVVKMPMSPTQRAHEQRIVDRFGGRKGGMLEMLGDLQKLYQHPSLLDPSSAADGDPLPRLLAESPKLAWLKTSLLELARRGEKVLIFTIRVRMQAIIARLLATEFPDVFRQRNVIINGDPSNMKTAITRIDAFSERPGFDALVLSPLAAGTGLTITAATHVIHYGRWWNPAREDQATDRAHRIGQRRDVNVWIPVLHHPDDEREGFDMKLHALVERKRQVASDFLSPADLDIQDGDMDWITKGGNL